MKVRAVARFRDLEADVVREVDDVWPVTAKRLEALGELVEPVPPKDVPEILEERGVQRRKRK